MKKENFDEKLKDALREYVKDTESEPTEKIKFSKRHERNMEEIFKAIENGTLGNFEVEENTEEMLDTTKVNKLSELGTRFTFNRMAKVAIFILLALVVSLAVTPGIEAWRKDELNLYGDNQDEYAWVLPNDVSEILDSKVESGEEYLEIFGWLPEGAEVDIIKDSDTVLHMMLIFDNNNSINFRVVNEDINIGTDFENSNTKEIIGDMTVYYILKSNRHSFIWNYNDRKYVIYGTFEYKDMLKIIKNINYEKVEKFF